MTQGAYFTTGIGAAFGKIVSGNVSVTNAGTTTQFVVESIPIPGVWVAADTGNVDWVTVGSTGTTATQTNQKGVILVPGNQSVFMNVNNLNLLFVNANNTGDGVSYAYLQPFTD